jgi:hypothetical protein
LGDYVNSIERELDALLDEFDVPATRRTDYKWLSLNIGINNEDHPKIGLVQQKLRFILHRVDI